MPIYEFYCCDCHTLFSFFSSTVAPKTQPLCPRCAKVRLEKKPSTFVTLRHKSRGEEEEPTPFDHLDEERVEQAMASLSREMGDVDEDNPRQLGALFRRFGEMTGLEMGPRMEDALRRLEAGEDVESLEADMGDDLDDDESMDEYFKLKKELQRKRNRPRVDDNLYFL